MMKAYDRLSWPFLQKILSHFGFSHNWIHLVLNTISNCHYSYLLNGEPCGFIKAERGIRQGDPLSPALFVLASEYLSRGLNNLYNTHPSMYFDCKGGIKISHLAYVDDCIIFCKANKSSLQRLQSFLVHYETTSGQKINLSKSEVFAGKRANLDLITSVLDISPPLPFTYLGAPISKGRKKIQLFNPLIDRIKSSVGGIIRNSE